MITKRTRAGLALACAGVIIATAPLTAQDQKLADRARMAGGVIAQLVADPENSPPNALLRKAHCIAAVPKVAKAGLGVGGQVGFGLVSCRTAGGWSLPSYMGVKGGSIGFQVGGSSSDVVLVFMNPGAPALLAKSAFTLGGAASVAAGPVGSSIKAEAATREGGAEIYSYSTKGAGLFAGISLEGTKVEIDDKANRTVYPAGVPVRADKSPDVGHLLKTAADTTAPREVRAWLTALQKRLGPGTLPTP